jgi:molecular chaperone Hsp33
VLVCDATALVDQASRLHKTLPTATAALGRALVGGILLGAYREAGEQLNLVWQGNGPLGKVVVVASSDGCVKGLVQHPATDLPLRADSKFDVGGAVGRGILTVSRTIPLQKEPVRGVVAIKSGEIAADLAAYLAESEQMGAAVALGVLVGTDTRVLAAGGYFVQVLPFASEETISVLERNLALLPSFTDLLHQDRLTAESITQRILAGLGVAGDAQRLPISYGPCNEEDIRARMERACVSLGLGEIDELVAEQGKLELTDDMCCCTLQINPERIRAMVTAAAAA